MGATAIALIDSPWGKRSGAHMNPALTLTFLRRGKIAPRDGVYYIAAQFAGALGGVRAGLRFVGAAKAILERVLRDQVLNSVHWSGSASAVG